MASVNEFEPASADTGDRALQTQLSAAGGDGFEIAGAFANQMREPLERLYELPRILYDKAPDAWSEEALAELTRIRTTAEWLSRIIIESSALPQRDVSKITGYSPSTVNTWRNNQLMTDDGSYGPGKGQEFDRRKKRR